MQLNFEWNPEKSASNKRKHGVSFEQATEVFYDPYHIEKYDTRDAYGEDRIQVIGLSEPGILVVIYTVRTGHTYRIISARKALKHERALYFQNR